MGIRVLWVHWLGITRRTLKPYMKPLVVASPWMIHVIEMLDINVSPVILSHPLRPSQTLSFTHLLFIVFHNTFHDRLYRLFLLSDSRHCTMEPFM